MAYTSSLSRFVVPSVDEAADINVTMLSDRDHRLGQKFASASDPETLERGTT